jgi:hypothetical protein
MLIKFAQFIELIFVCSFYLPLRGVLSIVRGSSQGLVCRVFTTIIAQTSMHPHQNDTSTI